MKVKKFQLMPNGAQQFLICHLKEMFFLYRPGETMRDIIQGVLAITVSNKIENETL